MQICFVMAPRQNHFYHELVEAIRHELTALGVDSTISLGGFPSGRDDAVCVLTPPHEYFALTPPEHRPTRSQLEKTILLCGEQPNTYFFDLNVRIAHEAGSPIFDINESGVRVLRDQGVAAERFQLGWTSAWAHSPPDPQGGDARDIDVLHLGTRSPRRERVLAQGARGLHRFNCLLHLAADDAPLEQGDPGYIGDDEKWELLGRSRVLLNIHRDEEPYFEWLRIVQAISNGCAVVSDFSTHTAPLVAPRDFIHGRLEDLGLLAEGLLLDEPRRLAMACEAYERLRTELPLSSAVERLVAAAEGLLGKRAPAGGVPVLADVPQAAIPAGRPRFYDLRELLGEITGDPDTHHRAQLMQALKDQRMATSALQSDVKRLRMEIAAGRPVPRFTELHRTPAYDAAEPRVSVLTPLFNYEEFIELALQSAVDNDFDEIELIIVDDGSTDDSAAAARRWLEANPGVPAILLQHTANEGVSVARNTALALARGELLLPLDADNTLYVHCISRLAARLDREADADFAYGYLDVQLEDGRSTRMLNAYQWNPARLGNGNYVDTLVMWRTEKLRALGGYREDRRIYGWEDFDLFCRAATAGYTGSLEPQFVARYRDSETSMLSITHMSLLGIIQIFVERFPDLFPEMPANKAA